MGKPTQRIMAALMARGKEARFVGGCVRDALARKPVHDIDIATQELPENTIKLLEAEGIKAVPTGLGHGTITAVCDDVVFEVTTLRSDVETDGRRAIVAFTEDWLVDAERRDFTFNAMSADIEGKLYDPFGGLEDLKAGRVRFVGKAEERIREDYLRILRFFRFNAYYGTARVDDEAISACKQLSEGIDTLSGERISQEFLRLLASPRPAKWISLMMKSGVLSHILPRVENLMHLEMLCAFENKPDSLRRLAVLLPPDQGEVTGVCKRFRMSNAQKRRLYGARCNEMFLIPSVDHNDLRAFLYLYGAETARDHVFLYWAEKGFTGIGPVEQKLLDEIDRWEQSPAEFPLQGKDLLELGYSEGPQLGRTLATAKDWWCEQGCEPDKDQCIAFIKQKNPGTIGRDS